MLLILRNLFRGARRFGEFEEDLGIAKNLLASRLSKLVEADIIEKVPYQDRPVRHEYLLTQKGRDLSPSLVAMMRWGDRWCNEGSAPTVLVHSECGTPLNQVTHCPSCNDSLDPGEIRSRPGPGSMEAVR
jgi:DNA-binding HxlR family transcriptional regulator